MDHIGRQSLSGLFHFTFRIWRANLVALVAVGFIAGAAVAVEAVLAWALRPTFPTAGFSLGFAFSDAPVRVSWPLFAAGVITGAATSSWASCTTVAVVIAYVRQGRPAGLRDLGCGLRYWPWVAGVALVETLVDRAVDLAGPMPLPTPFGLVQLVVSVLLLTVFAFYVQEIVALGRDTLAGLAASWTLVRSTGVWRVLGNQVLLMCCLLPIVVVDVALVAHFGTTGGLLGRLLTGVTTTPLMLTFVTVMYLLARGDRRQVEGVVIEPGVVEQRHQAGSSLGR